MTERLHPFQIDEGREAARLASSRQAGAENELREQANHLAGAERAYRVALAQERLRLHAEDGVAWTATDDLARGNREVANLRYARDVARGVYEAAQAALWRMSADRRDVGRFVDWSARREIAGIDAQQDTPDLPVIGSRRAA